MYKYGNCQKEIPLCKIIIVIAAQASSKQYWPNHKKISEFKALFFFTNYYFVWVIIENIL